MRSPIMSSSCAAVFVIFFIRTSYASDRALIEMAKTMDLNAIAKNIGRVPAGILKWPCGWAFRSRGWPSNGRIRNASQPHSHHGASRRKPKAQALTTSLAARLHRVDIGYTLSLFPDFTVRA
jgi:hypothetical protein